MLMESLSLIRDGVFCLTSIAARASSGSNRGPSYKAPLLFDKLSGVVFMDHLTLLVDCSSRLAVHHTEVHMLVHIARTPWFDRL